MASATVNRNSALWDPGSSVPDKHTEDMFLFFFFNQGAEFLLETRASLKSLSLDKLSFSSVYYFPSPKA